ncbi:MAG: flagellar motor switch protein FliG [Acidobacteriota bacterium]
MAGALATQTIPTLRKAAILLITLGEEAGAELMQQLSRSEVKRLSEEISHLDEVNGDQIEIVLREFYQRSTDARDATKGGMDFTQRMLNRALGVDSAKKLLAEVAAPAAAAFAMLEPLVKSDAAQVARSLIGEHPQTIALIVSHLPPAQAVSLLLALPVETRIEVALRMAKLEDIDPQVVSQIAQAVGERFGKQEAVNREAYGGIRSVADLCNRLDPSISQEILQGIESSSPETADRVRKVMFVFDDVVKLDDMAMTEINSRVERKTVVLALKGTSDQIKEHFTKKMSSRAREMLLEDLDALGPVKIKDVEEAQQEVIAVIRQLEQEGVISVRASSDSGGGDGYVA